MDIHKLLKEWPHGKGPNVRRIVGEDGQEKIQIRVCIDSFHGVLQFNCDGRPDGKRPLGKKFYLDHLEEKKQSWLASSGQARGFRLTRSQCKKLFEESGAIYHRYALLLQLGDFRRVIRDTARNMQLFRFVHEHAAHESDREKLECWWPYILRLHYTARIMEHLGEGRFEAALQTLAECREKTRALKEQDNDVFRHEMERSIQALGEMEQEIRERKPLTRIEKLKQKQQLAIDEQRYEEAARLRDRIARLQAAEDEPPAQAT